MTQVFISCPSKSFDRVKPIAQGLSEAGFDVWYFDDVSSQPNQPPDISSFRVNGIAKADVFLVIVTADTVASLGVARETSIANRHHIPILPVILEAVEQMPDYLNGNPGVKLGKVSSETIQQLASVIHALVERQPVNSESVKRKRSTDRLNVDVDIVPRIFIAYSHKQRPVAKTLSDLLLKHGKPHFWDAKIKAGATWRQTIQRALDDATHLIVIWTPDAAESGEVEREVSYALAHQKVIVPLLSQEIPKLPYHLHGLHYIVLEEDLSNIEADLLKAIAQFSDAEDIWQ
jgi:predicted nucleotide-binding protein